MSNWMQVSEPGVETLNFALDDLAVEGTVRFTIADFYSSSANGSSVVSSCLRLYTVLRTYDASLPILDENASIAQMCRALVPRGLFFDASADSASFLLLRFLTSNLQAERLFAHRTRRAVQCEAAGIRGGAAMLLDRMQDSLDINVDVGHSAEGGAAADSIETGELKAIQAIAEQVDSLLSDPKIAEAVRNPARIFNDRSMAFSRDEQAVIADISETLKRDFAIRRKMLLKRLDVTMQSFVWIEQAEGCENDVRAALDTQRKELVEAPLSYSLKDVLAAPVSLIAELSKRVAPKSTRSSSMNTLVKTVIIGAVPDRGGRAAEMKPKTGYAFGGRGGGYGGGGSGRGHGRVVSIDGKTGGHSNGGGGRGSNGNAQAASAPEASASGHNRKGGKNLPPKDHQQQEQGGGGGGKSGQSGGGAAVATGGGTGGVTGRGTGGGGGGTGGGGGGGKGRKANRARGQGGDDDVEIPPNKSRVVRIV